MVVHVRSLHEPRADDGRRARPLVWKGARQHRLSPTPRSSSRAKVSCVRSACSSCRARWLCSTAERDRCPERVFIRARGRGDALDVEIRCREVLQILVPDDHGLGVTAITEVVSEISVTVGSGARRS